MTRHVALLRGVNNIGTTKRVSMAELRALFESLGFLDVNTVLNSGNVVFTVPTGKQRGVLGRIEEGLGKQLGLSPKVVLLKGDEVVRIVRANPFRRSARDPSRLLVVVPPKASDLERLSPLLNKRWTPERLAVGERAAYLWCAEGIGESALWPQVDRAFERHCTGRNISTMTRLLALVET